MTILNPTLLSTAQDSRDSAYPVLIGMYLYILNQNKINTSGDTISVSTALQMLNEIACHLQKKEPPQDSALYEQASQKIYDNVYDNVQGKSDLAYNISMAKFWVAVVCIFFASIPLGVHVDSLFYIATFFSAVTILAGLGVGQNQPTTEAEADTARQKEHLVKVERFRPEKRGSLKSYLKNDELLTQTSEAVAVEFDVTEDLQTEFNSAVKATCKANLCMYKDLYSGKNNRVLDRKDESLQNVQYGDLEKNLRALKA